MLFDWLVVHQVVASNPTMSVRGPKLVTSEGKTPALSPEEVAILIESIPTNTLVGLRDRALIGLMAYTFARVGAALSMNVGDYYPEGKQWSVRLREKGGKRKQIAVHHVLEEYMDAYLDAAGIRDDKGTPLFRTAYKKTGTLTERRLMPVTMIISSLGSRTTPASGRIIWMFSSSISKAPQYSSTSASE